MCVSIKKIAKISYLCVFMVIIIVFLPFVLVKGWKSNYAKIEVLPPVQQIAVSAEPTVAFSYHEKVEKIPISQLVCGVVAAEMSAYSPDEAIKAQALAVKSYIFNKMEARSTHKDGADVCGDFHHCFAYISKEEYLQKWGSGVEEKWNKIQSLVDSLKNETILYNQKPICAMFFAYSSGVTENAKEVFGNDIPYLTSVYSKWDEQLADFSQKTVVSLSDFKKMALILDKETSFSKSLKSLITVAKRSTSGNVLAVNIGNKSFSGEEVRTAFSLRSSNFSVLVSNNAVTFVTKGYGHNIGLSQQGAIYMAKNGENYQQIIKWYYKGVTIADYVPISRQEN